MSIRPLSPMISPGAPGTWPAPASAVQAGGPSTPSVPATIAANLPPPAATKTAAVGALGFVKDFFVGMFNGGVDTVKGCLEVLLHPIRTVEGLGHMITHPADALKAITEPYTQAIDSGHVGQALGMGFFNALLLVVGPATLLRESRNFMVQSLNGVSYAVTDGARGMMNFTDSVFQPSAYGGGFAGGAMGGGYGSMGAAYGSMGSMGGGYGAAAAPMMAPPMVDAGAMGGGYGAMASPMDMGVTGGTMAASPALDEQLVQAARYGNPGALATMQQAARMGDTQAAGVLGDAATMGQPQAVQALQDVALNGGDPQVAALVRQAQSGYPEAINSLHQMALQGHPQALAAMYDPLIARQAAAQAGVAMAPAAGTLSAGSASQLAGQLAVLPRQTLQAALEDPNILFHSSLPPEVTASILKTGQAKQLIQQALDQAPMVPGALPTAGTAVPAPQPPAPPIPTIAQTEHWTPQSTTNVANRLGAASSQIAERASLFTKFGFQQDGQALKGYAQVLDDASKRLATGDFTGAKQLVDAANQDPGMATALTRAKQFFNQSVSGL